MSHVAPLFWHHGEPAEVILEEIDAMLSSGIREFIVEPRPHPDYLGPRWWMDMDIVVDAARERGMRVWFFDDARFPSGWLNGEVAHHPELQKRYLRESHVDAQGPAPSASFVIDPWLEEGDTLHAVLAARRSSDDTLDPSTLVDLTDAVSDGVVYWDVPDGRWRVVIVRVSSRGDEPETADYLNPIADGAAALHLATVHRAHFEHYAEDFGGVIAGFFQDEPRFGNAKTYEFGLGQTRERIWGLDEGHPLPYSALLHERLAERWGADAARLLPLLWWDASPAHASGRDVVAHTRYGYMDELTRLYESFRRELGDWCASHGVALIGHVVEDNGAHARLGYGAGHFFRAMAGQHMGGMDLVQHVRPGSTTGRRTGSFGFYDDDFYFWGLAKLASSAAHIDPRKGGLAMSEAFGAYGWHEGLRLMTWLTNHMAVRGINVIVPHAFSPIRFDPDCPPHFYNGGLNPQWPHFAIWRAYAERLSSALSGGQHVADAAVLYHAEAEWSGAHQPFERVIARLAAVQADADVVPIDTVLTAEVTADGALRICGETYPVMLVPFAERLPAAFIEHILDSEVRVVFVDALPTGVSDRSEPALLERLARVAHVVALDDIAGVVAAGVRAGSAEPDLRVLRYRKDDALSVFVVNESTRAVIETTLDVNGWPGDLVSRDLLNDTASVVSARVTETGTQIDLRLEPGEARLIQPGSMQGLGLEPRWEPVRAAPRDGWRIDVRAFDAAQFGSTDHTRLGALNRPGALPRFSGTIRYERVLDLRGADAIALGEVGESAQVWVDGASLGTRIAAPYRFPLTGNGGENSLVVVEVSTTLAPTMARANPFDASVALEPTGLIGPLTLERRRP